MKLGINCQFSIVHTINLQINNDMSSNATKVYNHIYRLIVHSAKPRQIHLRKAGTNGNKCSFQVLLQMNGTLQISSTYIFTSEEVMNESKGGWAKEITTGVPKDTFMGLRMIFVHNHHHIFLHAIQIQLMKEFTRFPLTSRR